MTDEEVAERIAKRAVSGAHSEGQIQYEIEEALKEARTQGKQAKTVFRATSEGINCPHCDHWWDPNDFPKKETLGDA